LLIEEVVALESKNKGKSLTLKTVRCGEVVGVPRLFVVLGYVGTGTIALAYIDK
jgi:hypothetical protein